MRCLGNLLPRRCDRRERIAREADQLLLFLGDMAYGEARSRARSCRSNGNLAGFRLWSKVAVAIARRTVHEIGVKAADRYVHLRNPGWYQFSEYAAANSLTTASIRFAAGGRCTNVFLDNERDGSLTMR